MEDIETVWDIPEKPTEPVRGDDEAEFEAAVAQYKADLAYLKKKEKLLAWHASECVSMAVGVESWGHTQKCNKLITDKEVLQEDTSGKPKVLVTVTGEAFGQVMFKNCRTKWIAVWEYKKINGKKATPPKYDKDDESTHKYDSLWSNPRNGQVEGGGWHNEGLEYLNARMHAIAGVREADKANGYAKMQLARSLIRGMMKWKPVNKKRSASQANNAQVEGAVVKKRVQMVVIDE